MFIGFLDGNNELYKKLQEAGFICIFKPTLTYKNGTTKGNCDAELVLHAMIEYQNYEKAVLVSGDGDFFCLAQYLKDNSKLEAVLVPNQKKYSALLKKINSNSQKLLIFLNDNRNKIEYQSTIKKAP
jgi:uncharacterized LabA/DUF88 family protein